MILSKQMQSLVKKQLEKSPLAVDELRRIDGMGNLFVSRSLDFIEEHSYLYSLEVNGIKYHFFNKK